MKTRAVGWIVSPAEPSQGNRKKIIRLDEVTIEGRIQKPQAFLVLQRSSFGVELQRGPERFIERIVTSVEKLPE